MAGYAGNRDTGEYHNQKLCSHISGRLALFRLIIMTLILNDGLESLNQL
jgi:hypothetical protein